MKNGDKMKKKCSCSSQNVIVITIETCNKKTCDYLKNKFLKSQPSNQQVSEENKPIPNNSPEDEETEQRPSDNIIANKVEEEEEEEEESQNNTPSNQPELDDVYRNARDTIDDIRDGNTFRLPKLPARHHGPGCAMEVSILERHEDNCIYKKAPNDSRNALEDRIGSYECVGRLVFKTCENDASHANSREPPPSDNEANRNPRPFSTNPMPSTPANRTRSIAGNRSPNAMEDGRSRSIAGNRNSSVVEDSRSRSSAGNRNASVIENGPASDVGRYSRANSGVAAPSASGVPANPPPVRRSISPTVNPGNDGEIVRTDDSRSRNESGSGFNERRSGNNSEGSYRRSIDSATYDPRRSQNVSNARTIDGNRITNVSRMVPLDDDRISSSSGQAVYNLLVHPNPRKAMIRKHYPGDNCKVHSPVDIRKQMEKLQNTLLDRNSIRALASSSKNFTLYIDEANQVPSHVKTALGPTKNTMNFTKADNQREASTETIITLGSNKSLPSSIPTQQTPSALRRFLAMFRRKKFSQLSIDSDVESKSRKKMRYLKY